jgi:prepilin-type N-terminal cleavage/methylation domain
MKKSFTLLELMIAIVILGVLSALISGNFITSLKKGRDARRKADLEQIQRALEMYYEDKRAYPTGLTFGQKLCETPSCPSTEKVYMQKVPNDPVSSYSYQYQSDGTYYRLFSCIENNLDQGPGVKQTGYTDTNCGSCGVCKYGISSFNTSLP